MGHVNFISAKSEGVLKNGNEALGQPSWSLDSRAARGRMRGSQTPRSLRPRAKGFLRRNRILEK